MIFGAKALVVAAAAAGLAFPALAEPAPSVSPGFYSVGEPSCPAEWGRLVFVPAGGGRLFGPGGFERRVLLAPAGPDELRLAGSDCSLRFLDGGPAPLGIRTRVLSHRGYTATHPANTIAAFDDAIAQGFPGFEMDVRLTSDGELVVAHDDRLFAATRCGGRVSKRRMAVVTACEVIYSPWIPELRIGGKKAQVPGRIPTVASVFGKFLEDARLQRIVLDLKVELDMAGVAKLVEAMGDCAPVICAERQRKLIFIVLDKNRADAKLLRRDFPESSIALESDETVSGFIDSFPRRRDLWDAKACHDTLSLSFGSVDDPVLRLVKLAKFENQNPARRLDRLVLSNEAAGVGRKRLLAWTVNSRRGVRRVARYQPEDVLTDRSYAGFIRLLMRRPVPGRAGAVASRKPRC